MSRARSRRIATVVAAPVVALAAWALLRAAGVEFHVTTGDGRIAVVVVVIELERHDHLDALAVGLVQGDLVQLLLKPALQRVHADLAHRAEIAPIEPVALVFALRFCAVFRACARDVPTQLQPEWLPGAKTSCSDIPPEHDGDAKDGVLL